MMTKSPIDRHREAAKRVLETPHYPWHDRQSRLHKLVIIHGIDAAAAATGFSERTIRVYLSYKPYDMPADANIINESRLIKAEKELTI